jgi:di/tricarboxylate transporter
LLNAGVVDSLARHLARVGSRPTLQVAALTGLVALCSGFMNNVGALALLMPIAIWMSRRGGYSPSLLLMPLAFGSLLGGTLTLIGTPPNIIIAAYREQTGMPAFGMFDFLPVGLGVTIAGLAFITLAGWRLTPKRKEAAAGEELFRISEYITELRVVEGSKFEGRPLYDLLAVTETEADVVVIGLVRGERWKQAPSTYEVLWQGDILVVEADSERIQQFVALTGLALAESVTLKDEEREKQTAGEIDTLEAVVTPESMLVGQTATSLSLRTRYGINVLAVARQGQRLRERLGKIRFVVGDILLLQGREESLRAALTELGCLPLAERGLRIGKPRKIMLALGIFGAALALAALNLLPAATALVCGAAVMVLAGILSPREAYKSIDLSIIVLLAAMLPIGMALETTGGRGTYRRVAIERRARSTSVGNAHHSPGRDDAPLERGEQCRCCDPRSPHRDQPCAGHGCFCGPVPDGRGNRCFLCIPHPDRPSIEYPRDGAGRIQVRRLLAHGPAALRADRRNSGHADPVGLATLARISTRARVNPQQQVPDRRSGVT